MLNSKIKNKTQDNDSVRLVEKTFVELLKEVKLGHVMLCSLGLEPVEYVPLKVRARVHSATH